MSAIIIFLFIIIIYYLLSWMDFGHTLRFQMFLGLDWSCLGRGFNVDLLHNPLII